MNENAIVAIDHSVIRLKDGSTIPYISPETEIHLVDGTETVFYHGDAIVQLGRKKALDKHWCHPEPGYNVGRCRMIMRRGERCKNGVREGWDVCHYHGAGRPSKPGGVSNADFAAGRHGLHLPSHLVDSYREFLEDPDTLNMSNEIALVDTRISEQLERLESMDTQVAWAKVKLAFRRIDGLLDEDEIDLDDIENISTLLSQAIIAKDSDEAIWREVMGLVEARRKLAETERRRIVDAQQMMTLQEANIFMSYVLNLVMEHVRDPDARRAIADGMRRFK